MAQLFKNNVSGVLASGVTNVATSMTLVDATNWPDPAADHYLATLVGLNVNGQESSWEIVRVTAKAGAVLTMTRAQESTTGVAWASGTTVQMRLTAATMEETRNASNINSGTLADARLPASMDAKTFTGTTTPAIGTTAVLANAVGIYRVNTSWTVDNRRSYEVRGATQLAHGFHDDAITSGRNFWSVTGGYAAGTTGQVWDVSTGGVFSWTINGVQALALSAGVFRLISSGSANSLVVQDNGANGANIKLEGNGATTPNKYFRAFNGDYDIINSTYTLVILHLTDGGSISWPGYATLGDSSPKVKMKKLSGTTGAAGANTTAPHGVSYTKILGLQVLVQEDGGTLIPPNSPTTVIKYTLSVDGTNVNITLDAGATAIDARPYTVLLTYEE